jgi:AcrR family transcriptional regulator
MAYKFSSVAGALSKQGVAMGATKRVGSQKATPARTALIDTAEQLIVEEGAHAATIRRIAQKSGVKFQLIYYYFNTLEGLLIEVYERVAARSVEGLRMALEADNPLQALWEHKMDPQTAGGAVAQFVSLAHQYPRIRQAVASNAERLRVMEVQVIEKYIESRDVKIRTSAMDLAVLLTSVSRTLRLERSFGISVGHENLEALVQGWFASIENAAEQQSKNGMRPRETTTNK